MLLCGLLASTAGVTQEQKASRYIEEWLQKYFQQAQAAHLTSEAEHVSQLLKQGQLDAAKLALEKQSATLPAASNLEAALHGAKPDTVIHLQSLSELDVNQALGHLTPEEAAYFRPLESVATRVGAVSLVRTRVKFFCLRFAAGYKNHAAVLDHAPARYRELVTQFRSAPQGRRIFLMGSGKDMPLINRRIDEWERSGYRVFFYKHCQAFGPLCDDDIVGAFMAESGQVMVVDTPAARESSYVFVEAATTQQLRAGELRLTLISPYDLMQAASAFGTNAAAATVRATSVTLVSDT